MNKTANKFLKRIQGNVNSHYKYQLDLATASRRVLDNIDRITMLSPAIISKADRAEAMKSAWDMYDNLQHEDYVQRFELIDTEYMDITGEISGDGNYITPMSADLYEVEEKF